MKKTGEIWWKQEEREERIGKKIKKHGIKVEKKKKKIEKADEWSD